MISIAIDGPAGSGKSTIAKQLASQLGFLYIDTGAMYRSATYSVLKAGLLPTDEDRIVKLVSNLTIDLKGGPSEQKVFVDGIDVTDEIRKDEVSSLVSEIAKIGAIRKIMVDKQQKIACEHSVVMDGRDIGTKVLPEADFKFFLTASLEERARRRKKDFEALKENISFEQIKESIRKRDEIDEGRKISPLRKAENAILIDTTTKSVEEILDDMLIIINKNGKKEFTS
ncbi:(d)CMP kinase [Clostridia bacterium]|nr:(d)CMP kinase [Clostridia bacterium]